MCQTTQAYAEDGSNERQTRSGSGAGALCGRRDRCRAPSYEVGDHPDESKAGARGRPSCQSPWLMIVLLQTPIRGEPVGDHRGPALHDALNEADQADGGKVRPGFRADTVGAVFRGKLDGANAVRPHASLGSRAPAPETIVPAVAASPTAHLQSPPATLTLQARPM